MLLSQRVHELRDKHTSPYSMPLSYKSAPNATLHDSIFGVVFLAILRIHKVNSSRYIKFWVDGSLLHTCTHP